MDIENYKREDYKKNLKLESILKLLNDSLELSDKFQLPIKERYPILFIVGTPRSGTTLLTQWLASLKSFCYPSNLVSRFYKAPYIGALVQEMLVNPEYSYKEELQINSKISFRSDTGKTSGILEPHEFWYYWRRFFKFPNVPVNNSEFLSNADFEGFQLGIHKFQQVFEKPFFLKSLIMNWYIESFSKHIYQPLFIFIKREPIANISSILQTRERYLGNKDYWFSFKPYEYELLKPHNPVVQVAGQVYFTNKTIETSLNKIPNGQQLVVKYEDLCDDPSRIYSLLYEKLKALGYLLDTRYPGIESFSIPERKDRFMDVDLEKAYSLVQTLVC
jgi:hypothetical protein